MKSVFRRPYIKIEIDIENKILIQNWTAFCTSKQFRKAQLRTIKYFKKYQCKGLIANTQFLKVLNVEEMDWTATVFTPELVKEGLQAIHFVTPLDGFAHRSIKNYEEAEKTVSNLPIYYFDSLEEAIESTMELSQ
jgi:hypothetical protein